MQNPPDDAQGEGRLRKGSFGVPKYREAIVDVLARAYADNNLELNEYENRLQRAENAQTISELKEIVSDFPAEYLSFNAAVPVPFKEGKQSSIFCLIGDRGISLKETKSSGINSYSAIGDTRVDLTGLAPESQPFSVKSYSLIGNVYIAVPPNTRIVKKFFSLIGSFQRKRPVDDLAYTHGPTVYLRGFKLIGDVIIEEKTAETAKSRLQNRRLLDTFQCPPLH